MEHKDNNDTYGNMYKGSNPQRFGKWTRTLRHQRTSREYPNYSIIQFSQNTKKSPRDLKKLVVIQTPVKDHQLNLAWENLKK